MTSCSPRATPRPDVVVVVASAAHLARSLYLVAQVRETALPVVVALTMGDVAARRGIRVDAGALARAIGCPVVALDPRRRSGVDGLVAAVGTALGAAVARAADRRGRGAPASTARRAGRGRRAVRVDRRGRHGIGEHRGDDAAHLVGPHRPVRDRTGHRPAALPRRHVGRLPGDDHARRTAAGRPRRARVDGPVIVGRRLAGRHRRARRAPRCAGSSSTASSPASACC